jgi:hypothetical protein
LPSYRIEIARFWPFFLKASKFPNKKATFDVNLVFIATLAFHHKKGHFFSIKKNGGGVGHVPPVPSRFIRPWWNIFTVYTVDETDWKIRYTQ